MWLGVTKNRCKTGRRNLQRIDTVRLYSGATRKRGLAEKATRGKPVADICATVHSRSRGHMLPQSEQGIDERCGAGTAQNQKCPQQSEYKDDGHQPPLAILNQELDEVRNEPRILLKLRHAIHSYFLMLTCLLANDESSYDLFGHSIPPTRSDTIGAEIQGGCQLDTSLQQGARQRVIEGLWVAVPSEGL
jgi:hypothetical protein